MKHLIVVLGWLLAHPPAHGVADFDSRMLAAGEPYYPRLQDAFDVAWPDAPMRSAVAAQIEKESRWNPNAELCVPKPGCTRERGLGLGQFTITPRFNVFTEVSRMHARLAPWPPEKYKDPSMQLLGVVVKARGHYKQCAPLMTMKVDAMACAASSYNGGFGGFLADRRICGNTKGCDPTKWFGHVAEYSTKAKQPLPGYGQSFYQINRGYAQGVIFDWRPKYILVLGS